MITHTPGPWEVSDERELEDPHFATVISWAPATRGAMIAKLEGGSPFRDGEGLANAGAIAAAPDLIEACELFTAAAHEVRDRLNDAGIACPASVAHAAEKARLALAKAKESPDTRGRRQLVAWQAMGLYLPPTTKGGR